MLIILGNSFTKTFPVVLNTWNRRCVNIAKFGPPHKKSDLTVISHHFSHKMLLHWIRNPCIWLLFDSGAEHRSQKGGGNCQLPRPAAGLPALVHQVCMPCNDNVLYKNVMSSCLNIISLFWVTTWKKKLGYVEINFKCLSFEYKKTRLFNTFLIFKKIWKTKTNYSCCHLVDRVRLPKTTLFLP